MANFDLSLITGYETIGADAASTTGTLITAHATVNTKGSWTELAASTAGTASWIDVEIAALSSTARILVDIGLGASGSEVVLLGNLHFDGSAANSDNAVYRFPVAIPAGSRVAARIQASASGATVRVTAILATGNPGGLSAPGSVQTYGADTSDSGLTSVDPGGTVNTDSAWVQLTASTTADARWLVIAIGHNAAGSVSLRHLVDVAMGAASSEVAFLSDLLLNTPVDRPYPRTFAIPVHIPAATRLSVRARCSSATSPSRLLDVGLYLADAAVPAGGGGASAHAFAAWSG